MRKAILFLVLIVIFTNCSKDSNEKEDVIDNSNSNKIGFKLDGIGGVDYTNIEVVTIDGDTTIDENGEFDNIYTDNDIEELPVIFSENNKVLFGYFHSDLVKDEITNKTVLLFFLKSNPSLAVLNLENELIEQALESNSNYENLEQIMSSSLNNNLSPYLNNEFKEGINTIIKDLVSNSLSSKTSSKSKEIVGKFKFDYTRDGKISWPNEVPLFASIGINIYNQNTEKTILKNYMIEQKSLSISSLARWVFTKFNPDSPLLVENYNFTDDGTYIIDFTNGNSVGELAEATKTHNIWLLSANILGVLLPKGLKTFSKQGPKCSEALNGIYIDGSKYVTQLLVKGTKPTTEDFLEICKTLSINLLKIIGDCGPKDDKVVQRVSKFLKLVGGYYIKILTLSADYSEILFMGRDFIFSEINGQEIRYFKDGVSVGYLDEKKASDVAFEGEINDIFKYESDFKEKEIIYKVDRTILTSKFIPEENLVPAKGLPFNYEVVLGGDVQVDAVNPITTDEDGKLKLDFIAKEKDSEINIIPQFKSSTISTTPITLKIKEENNEDEIRALLLSKSWVINTDNAAVSNVDCSYKYVDTCNDSGSVTTIDNNTCIGFGTGLGVIFKENGIILPAVGNSFFGSDSESGTYSVIGNKININIQASITGDLNPGSTTTSIRWDWEGLKVENQNFFILNYSRSVTTITNIPTNPECKVRKGNDEASGNNHVLR